MNHQNRNVTNLDKDVNRSAAAASSFEVAMGVSSHLIDNRQEAILQRKFKDLTKNKTARVHQLAESEPISGQFIVEDGKEVNPGQMPKSEFLSTLEQLVIAAANEVLTKIDQTSSDCPYIPYWFGLYQSKSAAEIIRSVSLFAPASGSAKDVYDYIRTIVDQVHKSFEIFVLSGSLDGVPEELPNLTPESEKEEAVQINGGNSVAQLCGTNDNGPKEYITGGREFWDDDDPSLGYLDDDFNKIKSKLPRPTSHGKVLAAINSGARNEVTLWRGTNKDSAMAMVEKKSAGDSVNVNVQRPTEKEAQDQIRSGRKLPEFTTETNAQWSAGSFLVVVKINTKYLTKASGSEDGFVCAWTAPLVVLATVDRSVVSTGNKNINAS